MSINWLREVIFSFAMDVWILLADNPHVFLKYSPVPSGNTNLELAQPARGVLHL
jgi:hypothetical protein